MASASISRLTTADQSSVPSPRVFHSSEYLHLAELPQTGHSPAIDLQRRLGEAALRGFYPARPARQGLRPRNLVIAGGIAIVAWAVVFGTGVAVIG